MSDQQQVVMHVKYYIKWCFEQALKTSNVDFRMCDMIGGVQRYLQTVAHVSPDTVTSTMEEMKKAGEIDYVSISQSDSHYRVITPGQAQTTAFGAPSDPTPEGKKKAKSFSKKAKQKAFDELNAMPSLGPGLTRLHEWLYEQIN